MEAVTTIRTQDTDVRALQWARVSTATRELTASLEEIRTLRPYIQTTADYLKLLRLNDRSTWDERLTLFKALRRAKDRLKRQTVLCSLIQSELAALQTALQDEE